uniref:Uncharacterized protein n=1 Tax=Anguilla anguilla TaxID=7936 RepID=A0A0E9QT78_ANGAN
MRFFILFFLTKFCSLGIRQLPLKAREVPLDPVKSNQAPHRSRVSTKTFKKNLKCSLAWRCFVFFLIYCTFI